MLIMQLPSRGLLSLPAQVFKLQTSSTHGTRHVAVLVPPAGGAGACPVHGVAGRPVGALTRLVAVESPSAAGAGDGAVYALPACTHTHTHTHTHTDSKADSFRVSCSD